MSRIEDSVWCDNCGVEIYWPALHENNRDYCCKDCMEGLPCDCGELMEDEDYRRGTIPQLFM